jgi:thioredoxin reductase (NADPH)
MEKVKVLIIGSGPAGYTAAIYASRAALNPVLYEGPEAGGQLTSTTLIENFSGFAEGIDANELMAAMRAQAVNLGADVRSGIITKADLSKRPFKIVVEDGSELLAETVIIATGASAKYLGLPSESKFKGMGVSACATCDGFFYRKKVVAVVGGGDTACSEAVYLSTLCKKVYMIVRRDEFRASKATQQQVFDRENIEILWNCNTLEVLGDENGVNGVRLYHNKEDREFEIPIDGFFLAIGHHPNVELVKEWIELDENGYIKTKCDSSITNVEGVFAAGDVQDPRYRQAITAAGSGCKAALDAEKFLISQE